MIIDTVYNEDGEFVREEPFDADIELDKLDSEPQNNEEWLKQCNTEQLADVLWEKINGAFNSGYACCNLKQDKDYVGRYKRFKEWLKQPHREESKQ